jgi:ribosomal protein S27AE
MDGAWMCGKCGALVGNDAKAHLDRQSILTGPMDIPLKFRNMMNIDGQEKMELLFCGERPIALDRKSNQIQSTDFVISIGTTRRLILLVRKGFIETYYELLESIDYDKIKGLTTKTWDYGISSKTDVIFNFEAGEAMNRLELWGLRVIDPISLAIGGMVDIDELKQEMWARQKRCAELKEQERRQDKVQLVLDFSALKEQMAKGGLVVQTIKCPTCGANVDLPAKGNTIKCQYCQSTIYAADLFEKLKEMLG